MGGLIAWVGRAGADDGWATVRVALSSAWRQTMVTCINVVIKCDDNDADGAMEPPTVAATGTSLGMAQHEAEAVPLRHQRHCHHT